MTTNKHRSVTASAVLHQAFEQHRPGVAGTWAIVDPASCPALGSKLMPHLDWSSVVSLFEGMPLSRDVSVAPLLLPLPGPSDALQARLIDIALEHPAVVWLASAASATDLAASLRDKLCAELANRQPITLRYYDPRVLPELIRVLTDEQRDHLGEAVDAWWWLDRDNVVQSWSGGASSHPAAEPVRAVAGTEVGITLADDQVTSLLDASFADRVLEQLAKDGSAPMTPFERPQRYALATQLIARARGFALTSEFDCANFIVVALQQGHDFGERAGWAPLMAQVTAGQLRFSDAVERWESGDA